jgi:hypothetical protein
MPRSNYQENIQRILGEIDTAAQSIAACNDKTWRECKHRFSPAIRKLQAAYTRRQAEADEDRALLDAARTNRDTTTE